jgi:hypothetical protein
MSKITGYEPELGGKFRVDRNLTWKTRSGETVSVKEVDDGHLLNFYRFQLRKIEDASDAGTRLLAESYAQGKVEWSNISPNSEIDTRAYWAACVFAEIRARGLEPLVDADRLRKIAETLKKMADTIERRS